MTINSITYGETRIVAPYENVRVEATASIKDGENVDMASAKLRIAVRRMVKKAKLESLAERDQED